MKIIPVSVIEVGTTRTVCMVGVPDASGRMIIRGYGRSDSTGVRMGEVTRHDFAVTSVRNAVKEASENSGCDIRSAWVIFSGGTSLSDIATGSTTISGTAGASDVEKAKELAENTMIPPGRSVLNKVIAGYTVDNRIVPSPIGLAADSLSVNMQIIHTDENCLKTTLGVVNDAELEYDGYLASGLAPAEAVLTSEQKKAGVLLVNLGGGTTSYSAFVDGVLVAAGSFGVGGDHVTTDIASAFHIQNSKDADALKMASASAAFTGSDATERAEIPMDANSLFQGFSRSVNQKALNTVVNARIDELFKILRSTMDQLHILSKLSAGIVLVGGGAKLRNITTTVQSLFNLPCELGRLPQWALEEKIPPEDQLSFATAYGALVMAARENAESAEPSGRGIFSFWRRS